MKKLNWLAVMAVASMALLGCENGTTDNNTPDTPKEPDTPVVKYDTSVEVIGENTASTNEAVNVAKPLTETIAAPTAGWGRSNYTYDFENPVNLKDLTIKITVKGTGAAKPEGAADGLKVYFVDANKKASSECITLGWLGTEDTTLTGSVMNPADGYTSDWSTGKEVKTYNNYDITKISQVVIMNYQYVQASNWDCAEGSGVAANLTSFELSAEAEPVGKLATLNAQSNWNDNDSIEVALPKTLQNTGKFKITISGTGPTVTEVFGTEGNVKNPADGIKVALTDSEGTSLGEYKFVNEIPEGTTITAENVGDYYYGYFNAEGKIEATFSLSEDALLNGADGISKIKFMNYTWAFGTAEGSNFINSSKVLIDSFKIEAITE